MQSSNHPSKDATSAIQAQTDAGVAANLASGPVITASDLGKTVIGPSGELTILADLNMDVNAAEAVAIVGPSGSGKSTLLGILAGLDQPTAGTVHLLGQSIAKLDEDGCARLRAGRVGFVFQSFQLLPGLSALENVMLPLELAGDKAAADKAQQMLAKVGLAERARHHPLQLSGGEQQRVAIARAFVSTPTLLFADEPTGNLDAETGSQIIDLMFELREQQNSALVLVTHDDTLARRCDRRLRMSQGQLLVEAD